MYTNRLTIREPYWDERAVGIDERRTTKDCYIDIAYTKKNGEREYNNLYVYRTGNNHKYRKQRTKYGNYLVIVPIIDLEVVCSMDDLK